MLIISSIHIKMHLKNRKSIKLSCCKVRVWNSMPCECNSPLDGVGTRPRHHVHCCGKTSERPKSRNPNLHGAHTSTRANSLASTKTGRWIKKTRSAAKKAQEATPAAERKLPSTRGPVFLGRRNSNWSSPLVGIGLSARKRRRWLVNQLGKKDACSKTITLP